MANIDSITIRCADNGYTVDCYYKMPSKEPGEPPEHKVYKDSEISKMLSDIKAELQEPETKPKKVMGHSSKNDNYSVEDRTFR